MATLYANDQVILQWNLAEVAPNNDELFFLSELDFASGTTIKFEVECQAVGDAQNSQCEEALLMSGRTVNTP